MLADKGSARGWELEGTGGNWELMLDLLIDAFKLTSYRNRSHANIGISLCLSNTQMASVTIDDAKLDS